MITTVELSLYPLNENYRPLIKDFLKKLQACEGLQCTTGGTSTVIIGEHALVMKTLDDLMQWSIAEHGRSVFVAKFLLDYDAS
ncbi:hypothetical protein [Ruficoccus sp. ZRK36]|uniref:hypothetical protein n=1 Tax=Ruficoccus sp. ZRK36 TaxID=2866311 RepID=UPI001C72DF61|nr:hypothetical protein [Ruficoccus sp. ZRK36]QYY35644.1 hypothetical protein K0V07_15265 [Ruficoccus sp. ZRK36]